MADTDRPREACKCPTGIGGLDEITYGGLPEAGRRWSAAARGPARRS